MVRAGDFSFWARDFPACSAYRALSHAGRHFLRRTFVHGAGANRTEIRYRARTAPGDGPRFRPAARPRVVALFHLAAFQTHAPKRDSNARTFAEWRPFRRRFESPSFLERRRQGPSLLAWCRLSVAGGRRLALFHRYRVERMGHSNLREFLVEHRAPNRHRISRRGEMLNAGSASRHTGHNDRDF